MPSLVDIPARPALFLRGKKEEWSWGEEMWGEGPGGVGQ